MVGKWGTKMKIILFAALALAIGSSAGQADELAASPRAEGARFAAMSLSDGQGLRATISNVTRTREWYSSRPVPSAGEFLWR
jgi:hypothetical protein